MSLSVLFIQTLKQRENISTEMQKLLESKIPDVVTFHCTLEEIADIDFERYNLILLQDESVALDLKTAQHPCIIFWNDLPELSFKVDIFLQLKRHTDEHPLALENWELIEVLCSSDDFVIYKAEGLDGSFATIKYFKYSPSSLSTTSIQKLLSHVDKVRRQYCPKGLVRFYEGGVCQQGFYLVMEYLKNGSLRQALNGCGKSLPSLHALEWFQEILAALICVHKAGLIHHNLKIDNIMLRGDGSLVLTDFGVSKRILLSAGFVSESELYCSPHYVSPEQVMGDACTERSDIYSLGVIFYELLTGQKPYSASLPFELMMHHIMAPVPVLPEYLDVYQPLLDKMMAKEPDDRFLLATDIIDCLPIAA